MSSGQWIGNQWLKGNVGQWGFKAAGAEVAAGFDTRGAMLANQHGGNYAELVRRGCLLLRLCGCVRYPGNRGDPDFAFLDLQSAHIQREPRIDRV